MADLLVERTGPVTIIGFNRPDRLNALTVELMNGAADVIEMLEDAVRVVVLRGTGRAFSAGADITASDAPEVVDTEAIDAANRLVRAIRDTPRPVVAAVSGPAAGAGCSVALAADLTVATESAYFLLAFASIGLMPDGGATLLVPVSIGRARATRMMMLPERISAFEAERSGLISHCVPDAEFDQEVDAVVSRLASGPTKAYAAMKRAMRATTLGTLDVALDSERQQQSALFGTADFKEGVSAFAERRPPQFAGH